jgi:mono/diheme cytochrome c family protein
MPSYSRILACAIVLAAVAAAMGAAGNRVHLAPAPALSDEDRKAFYHLAEGSELFPAAWLAAMDSVATGKPFLENLERFGLIVDPEGPVVESSRGKYPLPVGVTLVGSRTGRLMIGVNCAACHVGQMTVKDAVVRVDGGPNLLDIEGFYQEAFRSFAATLRDRKLLLAFLERIEKSSDKINALAGALREALKDPAVKVDLAEAIVARLLHLMGEDRARQADTKPDDYFRLLTLPSTKGINLDKSARALLRSQTTLLKNRIESDIKIRNVFDKAALDVEGKLAKALAELGPSGLALVEARIVFLRRLKEQHSLDVPQYPPGPGRVDAFVTARNLLFSEKDAIPASSPVRYPSIWNLAERKWLHWDANTNSVLERNIGQALGLGALATPDGHSTVLPRNLHKLETLVRQLKAPAWPKEFGKIDAEKSKQGRGLYVKYCAGCHEDHKGEDPNFKGFGVYTLDEIGTDPERALNFARKLSDGKTAFVDALASKLRAIKKQAYLDSKITPEEQKNFDLPDAAIRWVATKGYVARPLKGAWATAPYLHNGSVPTLDDLLVPAEQRPVVFPVGHREYNPEKLGYVSTFSLVPKEQRPAMRIFDTRQKGNSNTGHSGEKFGTQLSPDDRKALLEYLKGSTD